MFSDSCYLNLVFLVFSVFFRTKTVFKNYNQTRSVWFLFLKIVLKNSFQKLSLISVFKNTENTSVFLILFLLFEFSVFCVFLCFLEQKKKGTKHILVFSFSFTFFRIENRFQNL